VPDKAGRAETGGWTADLPAVDTWRAMVEVRHADADPAERRRAVQARTAKEIDASARLSEMSAELLCKDRIGPSRSADGCRAVVLARGVERSLRGQAWYGHPTTPDFVAPRELPAATDPPACRPNLSKCRWNGAACATYRAPLRYQMPAGASRYLPSFVCRSSLARAHDRMYRQPRCRSSHL